MLRYFFTEFSRAGHVEFWIALYNLEEIHFEEYKKFHIFYDQAEEAKRKQNLHLIQFSNSS
jgi:hypothetical protein